MTTNRAVWQDKPGVPGVIREAPIPSNLEEGKVMIKVYAWAINPADVMVQDKDLGFIKYPLILGQDVAGIVEAISSSGNSRFKVGDRIFGFSVNNGFQEHVVLGENLATRIPDSLSFAEAAVFPLAVSTSSLSLFGKDYLALQHPSLETVSSGKTVLIWGASSAAGSNAIQMTKLAGYRVIATSSPRNFDYVKSLGAEKVFDYNDPSTIDDIVAEIDKGPCAGIYLAMGKVADACQVSHRSKQKLFVASSNPIKPGDAPEGVNAKFTFSTGGKDDFAPTAIMFGGFLTEALESGLYEVAPPPQILANKGLESIQEGIDLARKGVSAKKIVIESK